MRRKLADDEDVRALQRFYRAWKSLAVRLRDVEEELDAYTETREGQRGQVRGSKRQELFGCGLMSIISRTVADLEDEVEDSPEDDNSSPRPRKRHREGSQGGEVGRAEEEEVVASEQEGGDGERQEGGGGGSHGGDARLDVADQPAAAADVATHGQANDEDEDDSTDEDYEASSTSGTFSGEDSDGHFVGVAAWRDSTTLNPDPIDHSNAAWQLFEETSDYFEQPGTKHKYGNPKRTWKLITECGQGGATAGCKCLPDGPVRQQVWHDSVDNSKKAKRIFVMVSQGLASDAKSQREYRSENGVEHAVPDLPSPSITHRWSFEELARRHRVGQHRSQSRGGVGGDDDEGVPGVSQEGQVQGEGGPEPFAR